MKIRKIEWHQVSSYYEAELDEDLLAEIYPDLEPEAVTDLLKMIESGEADIDQVVEDAGWDVEFNWDHVDDYWWTHRKGGYDVTYETVETSDEDSEDTEDTEQDIIDGLDALKDMFDSLTDEEKLALVEKYGTIDKCECSICPWSGDEFSVVTVEDKQCCPECGEPVIFSDSDTEE